MPIYETNVNLWAFPHIDDLAALFGIAFELDTEGEVLTVTYQGRQARFSTEGWAGLDCAAEHAPHVYLDFLAQIDVSSYGGDFAEWATSHDRTVDERQSQVLWRYYRLLTSRLQRLFAGDFEYILRASIEVPRDEEELCFSPQLVERFMRILQTKVARPESLNPLDVEPLMHEAQNRWWGAAFRHWLLSCAALAEETRCVLVN